MVQAPNKKNELSERSAAKDGKAQKRETRKIGADKGFFSKAHVGVQQFCSAMKRKFRGCFRPRGLDVEQETDAEQSLKFDEKSRFNDIKEEGVDIDGPLTHSCDFKEEGVGDGQNIVIECEDKRAREVDDGPKTVVCESKEEGVVLGLVDTVDEKEVVEGDGPLSHTHRSKEEGVELGPEICTENNDGNEEEVSVQPEPHVPFQTISQHGFNVTRILGEDGMGRVVEAIVKRHGNVSMCLQGGECVAIKIVRKEAGFIREISEEIEVHAILSVHDGVAMQFGSFQDSIHIFIVMERIQGPDLREFIEENGPLQEAHAFAVMHQLLSVLNFMHSLGIAHRDVKPENVMFASHPVQNGEFVPLVKLIDFGLAYNALEAPGVMGEVCIGACGTPGYAAPEVSAEMPYSAAGADVWSTGILLFEMLTGTLPYLSNCFNVSLEHTLQNWERLLLSSPGMEHASETTKILLLKSLNLYPNRRITASEAFSLVDTALGRLLGARSLPARLIHEPG